jgi:hypothetical protein
VFCVANANDVRLSVKGESLKSAEVNLLMTYPTTGGFQGASSIQLTNETWQLNSFISQTVCDDGYVKGSVAANFLVSKGGLLPGSYAEFLAGSPVFQLGTRCAVTHQPGTASFDRSLISRCNAQVPSLGQDLTIELQMNQSFKRLGLSVPLLGTQASVYMLNYNEVQGFLAREKLDFRAAGAGGREIGVMLIR